jgi:methionyl aminopeptidase
MVTLKTEEDIAALRIAGGILAKVLSDVVNHVHEGVSTLELDLLAEELIHRAGCRQVFKGYRQKKEDPPYPATLCTSLNDEVVHGIPNREIRIRSGDILGLDIGLSYPGKEREYFVDMARTIAVGKVSKEARRLMKTVETALEAGIAAICPGEQLMKVSKAIEAVLKREHLGVVRDLVGHGVGYALHEDPCVLNYVNEKDKDSSIVLLPGMVLALEPMANIGEYHVVLDNDGWTVRSADGSLSAHFEHTVAVTENGHEVLTLLSSEP